PSPADAPCRPSPVRQGGRYRCLHQLLRCPRRFLRRAVPTLPNAPCCTSQRPEEEEELSLLLLQSNDYEVEIAPPFAARQRDDFHGLNGLPGSLEPVRRASARDEIL